MNLKEQNSELDIKKSGIEEFAIVSRQFSYKTRSGLLHKLRKHYFFLREQSELIFPNTRSHENSSPIPRALEKSFRKSNLRSLSSILASMYISTSKILPPTIKSKWNVNYTISGLTDWLKRHGFSYKKSYLVPVKANADQQKKWLECYHKLKAGLPPTETICFTDGVHPTHNVQLAYGWIKKGLSKEIAANSVRSRINLTGVIDVLSHKGKRQIRSS